MMATGTDTPAVNYGLLSGDHHADTADLSLEDIAVRLTANLHNVQDDGMLPADAEFQVFADTAGAVPVLRVAVTCDADVSDAITGIAGRLAEQVFELGSHYNAVDLGQPGDARFLQHIQVKCGDSAVATVVGAMVRIS
jgi:hypothetical protein